jgi:glycosyltransferase involved in cell wall biosynthesis
MKEAAAFHVPTIYVKEAATAKGIECRSNGFLTENTSDSFADMIVDLIENPALVKKAGAGALKTIYTSWEMIVDSVYERYLKIIRDRKA